MSAGAIVEEVGRGRKVVELKGAKKKTTEGGELPGTEDMHRRMER